MRPSKSTTGLFPYLSAGGSPRHTANEGVAFGISTIRPDGSSNRSNVFANNKVMSSGFPE
jgi:hypothetical protein